MATSIQFTQTPGGSDAVGSEDGVRVFVLDSRPSPAYSKVHITISEDDARAWARQLTLAADEAADAQAWKPDPEQVQAFRDACFEDGLGVTEEHAIRRLQHLHKHGVRL